MLLGESANSATVASIREISARDPAVEGVLRVLTMHFGPQEILLNLEIQFHKHLSAEEVALAVKRIETVIFEKHPTIKNVFIEAQSLTANRRQ